MKSYKPLSASMLALITACMLTLTVSANSSWYWISSTRPFDLLPIVIAVTLTAETFALTRFAKVTPFGKVLCIVMLGNSLSFAAPYVFVDHTPYTFTQALEHVPMYTVGVAYLIATLLIELPVVYCALRKHTENRKRLIWVTVAANVVTTVFTALVERLFCRGSW